MRSARVALLCLAFAFAPRFAKGAAWALHDGATIGAEIAAGFGTGLLLLPIALAYSLPHYGFEHYPYEEEGGYGGGNRDAGFELRGSEQLIRRHGATHGLFRARGAARLGWDFALSSYAGDNLGLSRRASYYNLHLTANYLQNGSSLLDLGIGAVGFDGARNRFGPSMELNYELFPRFPWNVLLRSQAGLLGGRLHGDLAGGIGANAGGVGVELAYRAFLNPIRNAYGPEASLRFWF